MSHSARVIWNHCRALSLVLTGLGLLSVQAQALEPAAATVEFQRDIAPILQAKCQACHGGPVHENDLWLDSHAKLLQGGASGPAIVPGKADESLLFRVAARQEEPVMPPLPNTVQAAALTAHELALLRRWIDEGAHPGSAMPSPSLQWREIPESQNQIYSVAMSPDQRYLAAGRANRVILYDLLSKREVGRLVDPLLSPHTDAADRDFIQALAFSPDGRRIATGSYRSVKLWERQPPRQLAHRQLPAPVRSFRVDPTGQRAAFLLDQNEIATWDLSTGQAGPTLQSPNSTITSLGFSPHGNWLITGSESGQIRIWETQSGQLLHEQPTSSPIIALNVRTQGPEIITAHADNVIRVWSWPAPGVAMNTEVKPLRELTGHSQPPTLLFLTNEQHDLLSAGPDQTLRRWNLDQGTSLWTHAFDAPITAVSDRRDGGRIVVAGENGHIRLLDTHGATLADVKESAPRQREATRATTDVELATRQRDRATTRLQAATADLKERQRLLQISEDQKSAAQRKQAELELELEKLTQEMALAEAAVVARPDDAELKAAVAALEPALKAKSYQLAAAGDALQSAGRATALCELAARSGQEQLDRRKAAAENAERSSVEAEHRLQTFQQQREDDAGVVRSLTVLTGDGLFLAASADQSIRAWSLTNGAAVDFPAFPETTPVGIFSTARGALLTIDAQGSAALWDLNPRWELQTTLGPPVDDPENLDESRFVDRVNALAFSPDGASLATGGGDPSRTGELLIWNLVGQGPPVEFIDAHSDTVLDLQFSRDGRKIVSGGADKFCRLFDIDSRKQVKSFEGHTDHVMGVALSADGETLASGAADRLIKVWDVESGELRRTIENYSKQITSLDFIGSGDRLVSSSGDCHVKIHQAATGQNERSFIGARDYVYASIASPDGQLIVAGGEDGVVRVWNAQTGDQLMTFEPPAPRAMHAAGKN